MNARIQGRLLEELVGLIPDKSQLWLATHSIGMMRKARQLSDGVPGSVAFLDFSGADFDTPTTLSPIIPTRAFWESALAVAVDDLSELVAPKQVVVCEGSPAGAVPGKNASHDAICYNTIFANEFPDTKFLSGGGATDVVTDRLGFVAAISALASGIHTLRLIDRDDHGAPDIAKFNGEGIRVLGRRHIESYLFDDEVLTKLCEDRGMPGAAADLLRAKADALAAARGRGNPPDDVKSAAGDIYNQAKRILGLTGVGNDAPAFMRQTLSPLVQPGTAVYTDLRDNIFGP